MSNIDPIIRFIYISILKYDDAVTQLGMMPGYRQKIMQGLTNYHSWKNDDNRLMEFIKKYNVLLRRSDDDESTELEEGRPGKTDKSSSKGQRR